MRWTPATLSGSKTAPRCHVDLISDPSESAGSEIQVDVADLPPPAGPEILLKLFVNACPRQAVTKRLTRLACGPPSPPASAWLTCHPRRGSLESGAKRARPDSPWIQLVLVTFVVVRGTPAGVHRVLRKLYESVGDSAAACLQFNNTKPARMQACGHGVP